MSWCQDDEAVVVEAATTSPAMRRMEAAMPSAMGSVITREQESRAVTATVRKPPLPLCPFPLQAFGGLAPSIDASC